MCNPWKDLNPVKSEEWHGIQAAVLNLLDEMNAQYSLVGACKNGTAYSIGPTGAEEWLYVVFASHDGVCSRKYLLSDRMLAEARRRLAREMAEDLGLDPDDIDTYGDEPDGDEMDSAGACPDGDDGGYWPVICYEAD